MSSLARIGAFSLVLLLLAGCTIGEDYVRPAVDSPEAWRVDYEAATDTANTRWWKLFDDPVLDTLIDTALRENKDIRIAAARVEEFAARVDIFRSGFYPQLGYDTGGSRNRTSREIFGGEGEPARKYNDYSATVNLSWELDVWGRIRRATEAARADLLAQEENRRAVILSLVSAVATSYVTLGQLDQQLEVSRETLETRSEALKIFELKFKGGVVSELEVAQVRTEYEQAASAIPPLERDIALTENALSILLGHNPEAMPRGKTIDELTLPDVPAGVPSQLLERRPDIRAAEQNLIAADARIDVARAQYYPSISLTGLFGYASEALSDLLQDSANVWSIGGSGLGPIFTGGRISAQVRASEAVQRQTLVGYTQSIQTAFREVDDALISVQKSREQLVAVGRRVEALDDYARLARLRYDEGYASYIEVLDAQRFLFDAELEYVAVQGDVYASLIGTYKAMGGGWVIEAQRDADETDFPEQTGGESPLAFPKPTRPSGIETDPGYR
jgi:multidrug efflux system outer membrane protein